MLTTGYVIAFMVGAAGFGFMLGWAVRPREPEPPDINVAAEAQTRALVAQLERNRQIRKSWDDEAAARMRAVSRAANKDLQ